MMAMTGIFTGRRRIHPLSCARNLASSFGRNGAISPVHEMLHPPSALTSLALFYHHLPMNVIPQPVSRASSPTARKAISVCKSLHMRMERL